MDMHLRGLDASGPLVQGARAHPTDRRSLHPPSQANGGRHIFYSRIWWSRQTGSKGDFQ